nr:ABC transporter ATP-binding protein [Anaerolineae bacterium]
MTVVVLENLTKAYSIRPPESSITAVKDVSLRITPKEVLAILGPSGCGKTTLLRMIAGLETPDSGKVLYNNIPLDDIPREERGIGMVFQDDALVPHWETRRSVGFFLELRKREGELPERLERISQITGFGMDVLLGRRPSQLSGGEKQRVSVARALARDLQILLCDEPFSNLDAHMRAAARVELKRLLQEFPVTTVYVTHDQAEAAALSDRIAVMNDGRVEQTAPYKYLYHAPANLFVAAFIGDYPINLFSGRVKSGQWQGVNFRGYSTRRDLRDNTEITLGIRPEFVSRVVEGAGVSGMVEHVFPIYPERRQYIHVSSKEERWALFAPLSQTVNIGDEICCAFDPQGIIFFDSKTGLRIG